MSVDDRGPNTARVIDLATDWAFTDALTRRLDALGLPPDMRAETWEAIIEAYREGKRIGAASMVRGTSKTSINGIDADLIQPAIDEDNVPVCVSACPSHGGKRCRVLGFKPDRVCEPMVTLSARKDYRAHMEILDPSKEKGPRSP